MAVQGAPGWATLTASRSELALRLNRRQRQPWARGGRAASTKRPAPRGAFWWREPKQATPPGPDQPPRYRRSPQAVPRGDAAQHVGEEGARSEQRGVLLWRMAPHPTCPLLRDSSSSWISCCQICVQRASLLPRKRQRHKDAPCHRHWGPVPCRRAPAGLQQFTTQGWQAAPRGSHSQLRAHRGFGADVLAAPLCPAAARDHRGGSAPIGHPRQPL